MRIESKHKLIKRHPCDKCEYTATQVGSLLRHIKSKHEGLRYPCDKCEFVATAVDPLMKHI